MYGTLLIRKQNVAILNLIAYFKSQLIIRDIVVKNLNDTVRYFKRSECVPEYI